MEINKVSVIRSLLLIFTLALLAGCGGGSSLKTIAPLNANNVNLIFVVSPDLAYSAPGDVNPGTANLTNQGLQRSLRMASYLKKQVLGMKNVNRIYALEPMSHLQTANNYPDMASMGYIQQFAMLNQIALTSLGGYGSSLLTSNSYPLSVSYAQGTFSAVWLRRRYPVLAARGWISTTGRQQRSPGCPDHRDKLPGLLCLFGALGDH